MKIVVKQTDILKATYWVGNVVDQFIVYLMDISGSPLSCEIVYGKAAKNDLVNNLLVENFIPTNWENNKRTFDVSSIVEEVSFEEYMELEK